MTVDMPKIRLEIPALLEKSWKVFMEAPSVYLTAGLVFFVSAVVLALIGAALGAIPILGFVLGFAVLLGAAAVYGALFVGLLGMARGGIRGETPKLEDLFSGFGPALVPAAIATAIITMLCWLGTLMLVLPGLAVYAIYLHTWRFLLDGERDFWAAMESSRKMVFDDPGTWILVWVVVLGLNIVGAALCGVGLIAAVPLIALFLSAAYEECGKTGACRSDEVERTDLDPLA